MIPNHILIKLTDFAECDFDLFNARGACLLDDLIENCFCGPLFTHRMSELYPRALYTTCASFPTDGWSCLISLSSPDAIIPLWNREPAPVFNQQAG